MNHINELARTFYKLRDTWFKISYLSCSYFSRCTINHNEWRTLMAGQDQIDFKVDTTSLYREDAITDLKVASIRRMVPVTADGQDDSSRSPVFFGHTQILTPQGPLPLQAKLMANNLGEAIQAFPEAMEQEMARMVEQIRKMQEQEQNKQGGDSRIIMPGR
jgi:hypothetical protein